MVEDGSEGRRPGIRFRAPRNTERLKTVSQLQFLKDVDYPARLANYKRRIALFQKFAASFDIEDGFLPDAAFSADSAANFWNRAMRRL